MLPSKLPRGNKDNAPTDLRPQGVSSRGHILETQTLYTQGGRLIKLVLPRCTKYQGEAKKPKKYHCPPPPYQKRKTPRTRWQTTCHSCPQKGTGGNMLFDPTERDVNPFLIRTGIRTMTELILALAIHDKNCHHGQASTTDHHCLDRTYLSI